MFLLPEQDVGFYLYYNRGENELRDEFTSRFLDHYSPAPKRSPSEAAEGFLRRADNLTGVYAPVQTDRHTYGRIQLLFAGLMEVSESGDEKLTGAPLNFDAYSGLGEPTTFAEDEELLFFARADGKQEG